MALADNTRATTANFSTVATDIERLLMPYDFVTQAAVIDTTATSATAITSCENTLTVVSGHIVELILTMNVSNSVSGNWVSAYFYKNGSAITGAEITSRCRGANTSGDEVVISLVWQEAPAAGAHTYAVYWSTNADTAYSAYRHFSAKAFRNT